MKDMLADIQQKLRAGAYTNEEHVRLSLVARVLQEVGWDIWDPRQVNAEYVAVPAEDRKKVDLALFVVASSPAVYIEVKAVGGTTDLAAIERQLRDYNRDITAKFTIITDGQTWHFYYSQTGGDFASKRFKSLDLLSASLDELEAGFGTFLSRRNIQDGIAEQQAQALLNLSRKQRAMAECVDKAKEMTGRPPFPALPDALTELLVQRGFTVTREEVERFIIERPSIEPQILVPRPQPGPRLPVTDSVVLDPERPESLEFTKVVHATMGQRQARSWNELVLVGVQIAWERGNRTGELQRWLGGRIEPGRHTDRGFSPVPGTDVSLRSHGANDCWRDAFRLAKELGLSVVVDFWWRHEETAAHPGKNGTLAWSPS